MPWEQAMSSRQAVFDELSDSVMYRTMQGTINFWNRCAEELYGWRQEEAVGRVSHDLLQTQFPKPLSEIEFELLANGKWEGQLVHATRDGSLVVVKSRWILDQNGQPAEVVEINTRFTTDRTNPAHPIDGSPVETDKQDAVAPTRSAKSVLNRLLVVGLFVLGAVWLVYALFGRLLIRALYASNFAIADKLMAGRAFTPVENYYWRADHLLWSGTVQIIAVYLIAWLLIRNAAGALFAGLSLLLSSLVLFGTLEMFPSLIKTFHLDLISSYFAHRANHIEDDQLIFREKPLNHGVTTGFKGAAYSPVYGIDVPPMTIEWKTDEDGFRNSEKMGSADIVVLGDSYMEYGKTQSDTFPMRLQERLSGLTVRNLAKSGYGPFQYLEVLKRFGLKYKPRYVLFAFYEGNDIVDIRNYLLWKAGKVEDGDLSNLARPRSFFGRYWLALKTAADHMGEVSLLFVQSMLDKNPLLGEDRYNIHPDLAELNLGPGKRERILLPDSSTRYFETALDKGNWMALQRILRDFRDVSKANQITPVVLYVPAPARVYAPFSTADSGKNWLAMREREIANQDVIENEVIRIVQSLDLDFISLSPVFEREAKYGKLLYYHLDPHWNSEGRAVAAAFVADVLRSQSAAPSSVQSKGH
jgi:PAS domain S-box-containing protein